MVVLTMKFTVQNVEIGGDQLFLIAGPCVIESEAHALKMAECIAGVAKALRLPYIFKASFDKANRTSLKSFRGPGLRAGLKVLRKVADTVGVPVLTDIHEPAQAQEVAEACDILQIPAFLCRQTDLLVAAARTGCAINIKKGQFVSPWDMRHAVAKVRESGNDRVFLTERGASFGYNNLVVDMRSLAIMRDFAPVVFDATHSVQLPSAGGVATGAPPVGAAAKDAAVSGGQPQFIPVLARAAVAAGLDGIFMEVHDNPPKALSDGANALDLTRLRDLLSDLLALRRALAHPTAKSAHRN
jgi:2-dehydro-3-deoxyphosphooctonate aldolase (KDO 8-P synthase)